MKERTKAEKRIEVLAEFKLTPWMFGRLSYPAVKKLISAYSHLKEENAKLKAKGRG